MRAGRGGGCTKQSSTHLYFAKSAKLFSDRSIRVKAYYFLHAAEIDCARFISERANCDQPACEPNINIMLAWDEGVKTRGGDMQQL